ncbi:MAG: hypothetical protein ACREDR_21050 [Blastocatellia bacterium]
MNDRTRSVVLFSVCGAVLFGLVAWHFLFAKRLQAAHAVIVRDSSDSVRSGCDCTAALVKRAFTDPHIEPGSTVTVTLTGDASTANEPRLLASLTVPTTRQVMDGRDAAVRQRDKLIDDIKTQCEKAPSTTVSPIFLSLQRAVQQLRALGCGPDSNCTVYAQTDLEENGDRGIELALKGGDLQKQALPKPIDNTGINVIIAGVSETGGQTTTTRGLRPLTKPHDAERADRIRSVWERLFTDRNRLVFEPYCSSN